MAPAVERAQTRLFLLLNEIQHETLHFDGDFSFEDSGPVKEWKIKEG